MDNVRPTPTNDTDPQPTLSGHRAPPARAVGGVCRRPETANRIPLSTPRGAAGWLGVLGLCLLGLLSAAAGDAPAPIASPRPGQYRWFPEASSAGPVVVVVSLVEQRLYVYRNGIAIGVSSISSGRRGHETPEGTFTILQKARFHRSDLYDDAPMPFMQRLTWDGVALHAGTLPGYPASHGCIRLPAAFAGKLFDVTRKGETIIVAGTETPVPAAVHPAFVAPVGPSGSPLAAGAREDAWWRDGASSSARPVGVLVALRDRRVYVLQDGELIAESPLEIAGGFSLSGSLVLIAGAQFDSAPSRLDPLWPRRQWTVHAFDYVSTIATLDELAEHLRVPGDFARRLNAAIGPGTTVLVTSLAGVRSDAPAAPETPGGVDPAQAIR